MKSLIIVVLLLVVGIGIFGYYRGWFTVDQDKVHQDWDKVKELGHKGTE